MAESYLPTGARTAAFQQWDGRSAIVALVCSAGGLDALTAVLQPLPARFPAAIIVLQHQAPDRKSHLAEILARQCALRVTVASSGDTLRRGTVFVVPPGKHALVTIGNRIALIDSNEPPPYRPSADLLLTSLALVAPHRTIAVILSGGGHDGATGATAVHDFGGVVIAADKESSYCFSMPEAAIGRDDAVDHVVPVSEIPVLLECLLTVRRVAAQGPRPSTPHARQRHASGGRALPAPGDDPRNPLARPTVAPPGISARQAATR